MRRASLRCFDHLHVDAPKQKSPAPLPAGDAGGQGTYWALWVKLRNMLGSPLGKQITRAQIQEAYDAYALISDLNDDGPSVLAANPLNDALSGGVNVYIRNINDIF